MANAADQAMGSIHRMLNPKSIAIVGATSRMQYGGRFLRSVLKASPNVNVYPVNPRYDELMGVKCYPSVKDLPKSPDLVAVIVSYDRVMGVLEDCAEKGAGSAVVISAGFAERGTEDRGDLQRRLGEFARQSGVRVCGPNTLGVANVKDNIWASSSALDSEGLSGPLALVSQSGGNSFGPLLSRAVERGIGYTYIVSTGNEADLESSDFIRYLLNDPDTKVITCFIEGFKDARKFLDVAALAQERGKPIVVIKVGRSDVGSKAARSHTAALTGSDDVHDAVFKQYGVLRAADYEELLEISQLLAYSPEPSVKGLGVVSHSGGISSLAADRCGEMGLYLPELTEPAESGLNDILKGFGWAANPADVTGLANTESLSRIMELMVNEPEVGALVVASGMGDSQSQQVIELRNNTSKPVAFLWVGRRSATEGLQALKEARVPLFYQPGELARGIRGLFEYHHRRKDFLKDKPTPPLSMLAGQKAEVERLSAQGRLTLTEYEAKRLLSRWGIAGTREQRASTWDEAASAARDVGYPVVLKVESPDILHKTEAGLVRVGIQNEEELRQAYDGITSNASKSFPSAKVMGVLVQEMVEGGTEVIVGVSRDSQFGPVLLYGMGGIFVELYRDVAMRVCPITRRDALEMLDEVKGSEILRGFRGRPPADVDALLDTLMRVSTLAMNLEDRLTELDINPLAVLPQGQGVKALDALVVLKS